MQEEPTYLVVYTMWSLEVVTEGLIKYHELVIV